MRDTSLRVGPPPLEKMIVTEEFLRYAMFLHRVGFRVFSIGIKGGPETYRLMRRGPDPRTFECWRIRHRD